MEIKPKTPADLMDKILDVEKIFKLPPKDQKIIMDIYNSMLWATDKWSNNLGHVGTYDVVKFDNSYNTLYDWGYLITRRDKNIDEILDYDQKAKQISDETLKILIDDYKERTGEDLRIIGEDEPDVD